jgi:hypothetical protein
MKKIIISMVLAVGIANAAGAQRSNIMRVDCDMICESSVTLPRVSAACLKACAEVNECAKAKGITNKRDFQQCV